VIISQEEGKNKTFKKQTYQKKERRKDSNDRHPFKRETTLISLSFPFLFLCSRIC